MKGGFDRVIFCDLPLLCWGVGVLILALKMGVLGWAWMEKQSGSYRSLCELCFALF